MLSLLVLLTASAALDRGMALWPESGTFPANSLASGSQGQLTLRIASDADSAVSCRISKKSPFAVLDATACFLVAPRLDGFLQKGGKPVFIKVRWYVPTAGAKSNFDGAVPFDPSSWVGPDDIPVSGYPKAGSGKTEIRFDIATDGSVTACGVKASSGSEKLDQRFCDLVSKRAAFLPALDVSGVPRVAHGTTAITWFLRP